MNNSKLQNAFAVAAFLDNARWKSPKNYNLINFCSDSLSDDEKLLTHWFCYVSDRQMPFDRIWAIGGFVFSEIVHQMKKCGDISILDPKNKETSRFIRRRDYVDRDAYGFKAADNKGYLFVSRKKVGGNKRLLEYDFKKHTFPHFIPRYYPSDYRSILSTYVILEEYENSLTKYIASIAKEYIDDSLLIPKLVFSLYLLTYYDIGQPKAGDISFRKYIKKARSRKALVLDMMNSRSKFEKAFNHFRKKQIYGQKRAWCSVRDFFKSPEFNGFFLNAMRDVGFVGTPKLQSDSLLYSLELPGDVWNNNPKFRKCILQNTSYAASEKPMARLLREICTREKITQGYPEQFDVTFDFVQRMCSVDNCDICPFGILNGVAKNFDTVCVQSKGKYCPVILTSCNYRYECDPVSCGISDRR